MDANDPKLKVALHVVSALIVAGVLALTLLLFTSGGGQSAAVIDTSAPTTTSTLAATTTTVAPTTTVATTTTTTLPPTTTSTTTAVPIDPEVFDTNTKTATETGEPGSALTDIRLGDHTDFTRIVFDFNGNGTPTYEIGYEEGPTFSDSQGDASVAPAGSAFLVIRIIPGLTYDINDDSPTYLGPLSFDPGLGAIVEIAFVDDFEADMFWVIGLAGERGFRVSTRLDPQRLIVDIEN